MRACFNSWRDWRSAARCPTHWALNFSPLCCILAPAKISSDLCIAKSSCTCNKYSTCKFLIGEWQSPHPTIFISGEKIPCTCLREKAWKCKRKHWRNWGCCWRRRWWWWWCTYHQLRETEKFHKVCFCEIASVFTLNVTKCNGIEHGLKCINIWERDHHPQEEEEFSRLSESTNKTKRKKGDFFQRLDWDCLLTRIVFIVGCEKIQRARQRSSIAVREFLFVFLTNITNDLVHINGMDGAPVNSWQAFLEYKRTGFESRRRSLEVFVSTTTILFVSHCCKFFPAFDEKCFFVVVISSTNCLTTSVVCWRND